MSILNFRKITWGIVVWGLLGFGICYTADATGKKADAAPSATASTIPGKDAGTGSDGEKGDDSESSGFMSGFAEQIHDIMEDERTKIMSEIDKQRQETLAVLTRERLAATDDLRSERAKAFRELEEMGNRISERTIVGSKQLIDHFFIRLSEFTICIFLLAGLLVFVILRMRSRSKK